MWYIYICIFILVIIYQKIYKRIIKLKCLSNKVSIDFLVKFIFLKHFVFSNFAFIQFKLKNERIRNIRT